MDATLKIGGSLAEEPDKLNVLCLELSELARKHSIAVVPGGGRFADVVRELDERYPSPQVPGQLAPWTG
jgi:aspartokinase-like uncharacterized kinase